MSHENDHYEAFESRRSELRQQVDAFKTNNNDSELKEHIASELIKWKEYIRDQYRPEDPAEQSRLSNIADKVQGDIDSAFEYNDGSKIFAFRGFLSKK